MATAKVMKRRLRHKAAPGRGLARLAERAGAGSSGASPSGSNPMEAGVRPKKRPDSHQTVSTMALPTTAAAPVKPSAAISATQSGDSTTPPMLAPL